MITLTNKPFTVLEVFKCIVLCSKSNKLELGYNPNSVLSGFGVINIRKRVSLSVCSDSEFGSVASADWLLNARTVNACAYSKGKGFAGVIKRHGFAGLRQSHGVSLAHRSCGAIGARQDPGRVWKGTRMAGRMGGVKVSVKNLRIARYDSFACRVLLCGSVPGCAGSSVIISANS
ncbi:putative 50S ribosomal subunit protein L3 [Candidatus Hodgkinia cicadicola]|nr:putative 50S ribosomal subunit protein L3 [Candidatus Hodgkinia cicadicola]